MRDNRRTALITGASVGIGYELAKIFATANHDLVLVSRTEETLQEVAAECRKLWRANCTVVVMDLAKPGAAEELFNTVALQDIIVDVLVNNAGFGTYGFFAENETHSYVDEMQLNVVTLGHLTRLFLPGMIERGDGKILNVASVGAFLSGPLLSVYYATKAFVLHFSEALHEEVREHGVTVTTLCPGATHTEFHARAGMDDSRFMKFLQFMRADDVARQGYDGLMSGKAVVVPGLLNRLTVLALRFTPRWAVRKILFLLQRKRAA
jgi:short-subunit dehydrogenase